MKHLLFLALMPLSFFCQTKFSTLELIPVKSNEKWGYTDKKLKFVIPPQYDDIDFFHQYKYYANPKIREYEKIDVAKVYFEQVQICIKQDNTEVDCKKIISIEDENPPKTAETAVFNEEEYKLSVKKEKEEEENFIKENFPEKYRKSYENVETFYKKPSTLFMVKANGLYGIVNQQNEIIIPIQYNHIQRSGINDKRMFFAKDYKNEIFELFDNNGKSILKMSSPPDSFNNNGQMIVRINKEKSFRIFDMKTERFINKKSYTKISGCSSNGFCRVERDNNEFYVDEAGKEYIR